MVTTRCNGKERCLTCRGDHPTGKCQKCSKEAAFINCGGDHTDFSKDCGKRADEEKINSLMATKNISAKEARPQITAPLGLLILDPRKKISLCLTEGTLTLSRQKSRIPFENPKMTPTTTTVPGE
jgi:hypothetical protein